MLQILARGTSVSGAGAGMEGLVTVESYTGTCDIAWLLRGNPGRFPVADGLGGRIAGGRGRYLVPLRVVLPS